MIDKIYIPTIRRTTTQITYDNLPDELKKKVVMVVEPAERNLYNYDCDYLTLPDNIVGSYTQLAETRKFIHKHAGTHKYIVADDDLIIRRKNSKYWSDINNMECSNRVATPDEILEMIDTFDEWLDEDNMGVVGPCNSDMHPGTTIYQDTMGVFSFVAYDGRKISKVIDDMDITCVRIAEDVLFIYECLSRGINTRVSIEYQYDNRSMANKDLLHTRQIWTGMYDEDNQPKDYLQADKHYDALSLIRDKFPHGMKIYEKNGKMKNTKYWKKVYKRYLDDERIKIWCEDQLRKMKENE
jgi:hypothetical protein